MSDLRMALATALRETGGVRGVAGRYGRFNDVYYDQWADDLLAAIPEPTLLASPTSHVVYEAVKPHFIRAGLSEERFRKAWETGLAAARLHERTASQEGATE